MTTIPQADRQSITIHPVGHADLYKKYDRQSRPQPCHLELYPATGDVYCDFDGEIGNSMPASVWHGRTLQWSIPCLTGEAAVRLMEDLTPLLERIRAGHTVSWNGSNHVGSLNDDAREASSEIEREIEALDGDDVLQVWEASDWYQALGGAHQVASHLQITADTTDERLAEIAESEVDIADTDGIMVEGVQEYLEYIRKSLREEAKND